MMNNVVGLIALIIFFAGCSTQETGESTSEGFDEQRIEREVRQMLKDYHHDIQRDGLLAEFKYLDSTDQFFWIPPGYASSLSYDSVRKILEVNASFVRQADFQWDTLQVVPLSEEFATYSGIVIGKITDTSGVITLSKILESGTLIKRGDGWKLLSGQSVELN